ncbi:MAG: GGDEF domain-containing protein [Desulfovibrionaceae bacterium]|jgi:diguanylate cyclase (GGDEF)-like protein/PAS domain S-box-containing protein|nr:GGDEF domain-containing protein [Desulfovibrionaceae bacterium]
MAHDRVSLFGAEEGVIAWAEEALGPGRTEPLSAAEGARLLREYRKLYRQCTRLVTLGDRMQRQLNGLNEQLAASEKKYRDIFENVVQGIFLAAPSGRVNDANVAMARLLGCDGPGELMAGPGLLAFLSDEEDWRALLEALLVEGGVSGHALRMNRRDGRALWVELFARAHFNGARLVQVEALVSDVTEQRAALETLREQARVDVLTGLYNRRYFMELSHREVARARREGRPASLVYFDVDHFKAVNDRLGHEAGDEVLRTLAALARASVRDLDIVGRLGGEEFAVLLPDTDRAGACCLAEKLRAAFAGCPVATCGGEVRCTASFGLAELGGRADCLLAMLRRADAALYRAKAGGRNAVCAHCGAAAAEPGAALEVDAASPPSRGRGAQEPGTA